jgi:hypothetical protein
MELDLSTRPDLVSNVTNLLFRLPQGGERLLAPGTSILDVYDGAAAELLILGAPGAGKSTLLLDLAQQLVVRALADPGHPLPIILRLSSWAVRRPALAEWMIEQLSQTYDVPRALSERWVRQGRLLPLLDGFDEVEEDARPACIAAINHYHRTHLTPLVVCSRQAEYEGAAQAERLALQSAVIVQPMSEAQIEAYLSAAGPAFAGVRAALSQEQALRELATTPLMLSVLLLTYRGATTWEVIQRGTELERQVWTDYVARQVAEKGHPTRYPLERTRAMLSWLAQQMYAHRQSLFYAEYLQTDWLALDQQRSVMWLAIRLPAMLIGGCAGLLVFVLVFLLVLSSNYPILPQIGVLSGDYVTLLQIGVLSGFIGESLSQQVRAGLLRATHHLPHERQLHFRKALLLSVLLAASCGLYLSPPQPGMPSTGYSFLDWGRDGCLLGLGSGLSFWVFQVLLDLRGGYPGRKTSVHSSWIGSLAAWVSRMANPSVWQAAAVLGAGMGLTDVLRFGLPAESIYGLSLELNVGLIVGLSVGITVVLVHVILANAIGSLRFAERIRWTWRGFLRPEHLRTSLSIAGMLILVFGLNTALSTGLSVLDLKIHGVPVPIYGLSYGLSVGPSLGLSLWLLMGLYQGMKQEHLEDQDRQQFNQGIRCSLRNGLLLSLISTILISTIRSAKLLVEHRAERGAERGTEHLAGRGAERGAACRAEPRAARRTESRTEHHRAEFRVDLVACWPGGHVGALWRAHDPAPLCDPLAPGSPPHLPLACQDFSR